MARFEVRCHELGDGSDYHWCYCETREEGLSIVKEFEDKNPGNTYEHLYVVELREDETKSVSKDNCQEA